MKKVILATCLALSMNAMADDEWIDVSESNSGNIVQLRSGSVAINRSNSSYRRAWTKFVNVDKTSAVYYVEFNCDEQKFKLLFVADYAATGSINYSNSYTNGKWSYIPPGSHYNHISKIVCNIQKDEI